MDIPTRCTAPLDIDTPVIQAPMAGGTTTPELVAAVSNAGGLGSIGAGYLDAGALETAIAQTRALTDRPFAVNLFIPQPIEDNATKIAHSNSVLDGFRRELGIERPAPPDRYAPDFDAQFGAVAAAGVAVFSFTFGLLDATRIARLKHSDTTIIGTATTVAEALALEAAGVDMIVAQGAEAGGHRGTFMHEPRQALIGSMALIPQVVDAVSVPVIASGGIMDGRGVAAAFMLGAGAVQMGSAFLVCEESGANPAHQRALLTAAGSDTVVTRAFSGKAARGLRNRFIEAIDAAGIALPDYPIQNAWTKDVRAAASAQGETDFMSLWAGQGAALGRRTGAADLVAAIRAHLEKI